MKFVQYLLRLLRRHQRKETKPDPEKGAITVAETLIALGIGSTVLAVVFAGIPALTDARNHSTSMSGLTQIVTSIRSTFGVRNNFNGLNTDLARQLAGFPPNFISGDDIRHPWGGIVTITGDNDGTFDVVFAAMPEAACSQLVTSTADLAQGIDVGGTVLGSEGLDDDDGNPTDPKTVTELCDGGAQVTWTFRG